MIFHQETRHQGSPGSTEEGCVSLAVQVKDDNAKNSGFFLIIKHSRSNGACSLVNVVAESLGKTVQCGG